MKFSTTVLIAVASADDKSVPPRHPLHRLATLKRFSTETINRKFSWLKSKESWVTKFANNADRMERNFNRGQQRCGFYDADLPNGGPAPDRRRRFADDELERLSNNPSLAVKQLTTGFRKWAERYLSACSGQKKHQYQVNRMNSWNTKLQAHLAKAGFTVCSTCN